MPFLFKKILLFILFIVGSVSYTYSVKAHPQPYFVQEFYVNFSEDKVSLNYKIYIDPIVLEQLYHKIDTNRDDTIQLSEIEIFTENTFFKNSTLRLNNRDLKFKFLNYKPIDKNQITSLDDFTEVNYEAIDPEIKDENNFYFLYGEKLLPDDPNGDLIVINDNTNNSSNLERIKIASAIREGKNEYDLSFKILNFQQNKNSTPQTQSNSKAPTVSSIDKITDYSKKLASKVFDMEKNGFGFALIALGFAFVAGMLHAFKPGHGKSMMAAFLIGKKDSKVLDIIILAISITLSHTAVIYILGFILKGLEKQLSLNKLLPQFERISGILLVLLALNIIRSVYINYKKVKLGKLINSDEHSHMGITHSHGPTGKVKIKSKFDLFLAGLSGGIIPCDTALLLLITAVTLNKIAFGIILVFFFSLGLAAAIVSLGLILVFGKNKLKLDSKLGKIGVLYLPLIAAIVLLILAIGLIF